MSWRNLGQRWKPHGRSCAGREGALGALVRCCRHEGVLTAISAVALTLASSEFCEMSVCCVRF